jgi:hypothetical protein
MSQNITVKCRRSAPRGAVDAAATGCTDAASREGEAPPFSAAMERSSRLR